jgi:hypothetical protein
MSRLNQSYRLRKDAKGELWTDQARTYDQRTADENRERQKRDWKFRKGEVRK